MNKKGFYFTVDAFMALGVLVVGFLLIWASYVSKPLQAQTGFFSTDLLDQMAGTKVVVSDNPEIFKMWCTNCDGATHIVDRPENTILEQIGEFIYFKRLDLASELAEGFSAGLINPQYGYELTITGVNIDGEYNEWSVMSKDLEKKDDSRLLITSKKLIYGTVNKSLVWGPMVPEVRVWQ